MNNQHGPPPEGSRKGVIGYESVYGPDADDNYIFGTNDGYITLNINEIQSVDFEVGIDRIELSEHSPGYSDHVLVNIESEGEFSNKENKHDGH